MNEFLLVGLDLGFWATVSMACLFGAMSPGPSLAVVVNHTLARGSTAGSCAAISHGLAIAVYAAITTFGLSVVISNNQQIFDAIQVVGCVFLLVLAYRLWSSSPITQEAELPLTAASSNILAIRDGLAIAFFNPKILLFFMALFSQFVRLESSAGEKIYLALIAGGVDMLWYLFVVAIISRSGSIYRFHNASGWLNKCFGLILAFIAVGFIVEIAQAW